MLATATSSPTAFASSPRSVNAVQLSPRIITPIYSPHSFDRRPAHSSPAASRSSPSVLSRTQSVTRRSPTDKTPVDAGTQYSPPDWPPTSSRSSIWRLRYFERPQQSTSNSPESSQSGSPAKEATVDSSTPAHSAPPEPRLRVTPQLSLNQANQSAESSQLSLPKASSDHRQADSGRSTPPKKHRKEGQVKLLPKDYTECDTTDLSILIADLLLDLIRHNDDLPLKEGQLTRFHSRTPPGISVPDYLKRLVFHATLPCPVLLSMVFYIDRLCAAFPVFTINSLTVHRFLIAAATVAAKGLCDVFWTNSTYAKVGGVSVKELSLLELELLTRVEWRIVPDPDSLVEYYNSLVGRSKNFELESTNSSSSGSEDEDKDMMHESDG